MRTYDMMLEFESIDYSYKDEIERLERWGIKEAKERIRKEIRLELNKKIKMKKGSIWRRRKTGKEERKREKEKEERGEACAGK